MKKKDIKMLKKQEEMFYAERLKAEQFKTVCDHKITSKGKTVSKLEYIGQNENGVDTYKCRLCGTKLDLEPISKQEIAEATAIVRRVIEQTKVVDDDISSAVMEKLGFVSQLMLKLDEFYDDTRYKLMATENEGKSKNNYEPREFRGIDMSHDRPMFFGEYSEGKKKHKKNKDKDKKHKHGKNKKKDKFSYWG